MSSHDSVSLEFQSEKHASGKMSKQEFIELSKFCSEFSSTPICITYIIITIKIINLDEYVAIFCNDNKLIHDF